MREQVQEMKRALDRMARDIAAMREYDGTDLDDALSLADQMLGQAEESIDAVLSCIDTRA